MAIFADRDCRVLRAKGDTRFRGADPRGQEEAVFALGADSGGVAVGAVGVVDGGGGLEAVRLSGRAVGAHLEGGQVRLGEGERKAEQLGVLEGRDQLEVGRARTARPVEADQAVRDVGCAAAASIGVEANVAVQAEPVFKVVLTVRLGRGSRGAKLGSGLWNDWNLVVWDRHFSGGAELAGIVRIELQAVDGSDAVNFADRQACSAVRQVPTGAFNAQSALIDPETLFGIRRKASSFGIADIAERVVAD